LDDKRQAGDQQSILKIVRWCRDKDPPIPLRTMGKLLIKGGYHPPRGGLEWSTASLSRLCRPQPIKRPRRVLPSEVEEVEESGLNILSAEMKADEEQAEQESKWELG